MHETSFFCREIAKVYYYSTLSKQLSQATDKNAAYVSFLHLPSSTLYPILGVVLQVGVSQAKV